MTPSKKEEPLAFMPSSNDAIHTIRDSNGFSSPPSSIANHKSESDFHKHHLLPHESATLSPSRSRSEDTMSPFVRSGTDLPLRASVPSASQLPQDTNDGVQSKTQTNWQELYFELCSHNDKVVRGLRQHIETLEAELRKSRIDSGVSQHPWAENNNSHFNPAYPSYRDTAHKPSIGDTISPTNGYLDDGRISVIKTTPETSFNGNLEQQRSSSTGSQQARGVNFSQLQSIPENSNANQTNGCSVYNIYGSENTDAKWPDEDPPSPPTTAMVPSPPNLRTHAGRTPPDPAMMEQRPLNDINGQRFSGIDGVDEDPALQEPRIISSASEIEDLHQRLKQVESDPEMHPPQALQSQPYVQSSVEFNSENGRQSAGDAVEGVRLKRKPSTNFGVAWGMARNDIPKRSSLE